MPASLKVSSCACKIRLAVNEALNVITGHDGADLVPLTGLGFELFAVQLRTLAFHDLVNPFYH